MGSRCVRGLAALAVCLGLCGTMLFALGMSGGLAPRGVSAQPACGELVELIANGGFESPVAPEFGTPPDDWSGGNISTGDAHSGNQSIVLALDYATTSQTIDVTGLEGTTLTLSVWAHSGGSIAIGDQTLDVGWNQPDWGNHTLTYTVAPGETTVVVTLNGGASQGNFDDVSVTYVVPCEETPTPETPEPGESPTPTSTATEVAEPTETTTPVATETSTAPEETVVGPTVVVTTVPGGGGDLTPTPASPVTALPETGSGPSSTAAPLAVLLAMALVSGLAAAAGWVRRAR